MAPSPDDEPEPGADDVGLPGVIRHCPFCGELVGSFWGRTAADGATWCESCQVFFEVRVQ